MRTRKDLSVIVPLYNAADTIADTLASVLNQTLSLDRVELIVVDDGSTDDGVEVAQRALDAARVEAQIIRHEANLGASAARNTGWQAARSRWLQFLDADDLLDPGKCELQLTASLDAPDTVAVIYSPWSRLVQIEDGGWAPDPEVVSPHIGPDALLDLLRADNFLASHSYLLRRDAVARVGGYDPSVRVVEDVALLVSLTIDGGLFMEAPCDRPMAWYRQRPGSLSRRNRTLFVEGCVMNARRAEEVWRQGRGLTDSRRRVLADVYYLAVRHMAAHDPGGLAAAARQLDALVPGFIPVAPAGMRRLSEWLGYATAARVAVKYRRARRWIGL